MIKLEFNEFNPQIYVLPFNIDSIANAIIIIDSIYYTGSYSVIERKGYDFILSSSVEISYIYVYRNNPWKRVRECYYLSVTLRSLAKDLTRVTVRKIENSVSYGVKIWKGPPF